MCVRVGDSETICTKRLMSSGPGKRKQPEGLVGHQGYSLSTFPKVYDFTVNGSGLVLQPVHDSHDKQPTTIWGSLQIHSADGEPAI